MITLEELTLFLLQLKGVGKATVKKIIDSLVAVPISYGDFVDLLEGNRLLSKPLNNFEIETAIQKTKDILERSKEKGIQIICYKHPNFPKRFLSVSKNAPVIIYALGNTELLNYEHNVALIGTREPTPSGLEHGKRISQRFSENGFCIVSGLALGCDTIGHTVAVENHTPTIAILAGGLDQIYPKQNQKLAEKILDTGGLLISEYEVGAKSDRFNFVERDRLQSALSDCVVVIETDEKGGTLHTVGYAIEQNKPVATMYTHILKYQSEGRRIEDKMRGNIMLVEQKKAVALRDKDSLLEFMQRFKADALIQISPTIPIIMDTSILIEIKETTSKELEKAIEDSTVNTMQLQLSETAQIARNEDLEQRIVERVLKEIEPRMRSMIQEVLIKYLDKPKPKATLKKQQPEQSPIFEANETYTSGS